MEKTKTNIGSFEIKSPVTSRQYFDRLLNHEAFKLKLNEIRLVQKYQNNKQDIKVSVIMPTYNRAFIIDRAIESVLGQRYNNYELIISDDGSTDDTGINIKRNYGKNKNIRYIRNRHSGPSSARNAALGRSTGEVITYLDSDNEWSENYLLLMANTFLENPDAGTAYSGVRVIDNVYGYDYIRLKPYDFKSLLQRNYIDLNIFAHRKELFEILGGFDTRYPPLEDWDLIVRYTKEFPPQVLNCCLATYYMEKEYGHLTLSDTAYQVYEKLKQKYSNDIME